MDSRSTEILDVLRARGALSKEEIVQTWGLSEQEYADLKRDFSAIANVEPGPRKVGGFRAKSRRSVIPTEAAEEPIPIPGAAWETIAVARLCELFQHKELEDLLGDLVYTVRLARKTATG